MKSKQTSRAVYSTDQGRLCPQCLRGVASCVCGDARPAYQGDGVVRISKETKGRGGKAVTVVDGLPLSPSELKNMAKKLKQKSGVGGSVKDEKIEIQGDQRAICKATLEALGYRCKLAGG